VFPALSCLWEQFTDQHISLITVCFHTVLKIIFREVLMLFSHRVIIVRNFETSHWSVPQVMSFS
jgi:hypothetical protein